MSSNNPSQPPMNQRAVMSLGLAVVAFVLLAFEPFLSLVFSLPSLTMGVHARRAIAANDEPERGFDLAGTGLVIAAATLLLAVVAIFLDLL